MSVGGLRFFQYSMNFIAVVGTLGRGMCDGRMRFSVAKSHQWTGVAVQQISQYFSFFGIQFPKNMDKTLGGRAFVSLLYFPVGKYDRRAA